MHLIVGERQQGHTTRLIKMSADGKGTIVTATKRSAEYVKNQAKEMGLDIPKPINWEMFIHSYMMKTGPFLLDELGVILSNYGITTATIDTGGSIENLSEMQSHYGDELAAQIREITTDYNSLSDFEKFVLDNGYRYTTHEELRDGYNRHWKAAHDVLITMEEFLAEAEKELGDPAADVYEVLVRLVEEKKLKPGDLLGYAHYHWCLDKPEAIVAYQTGRNEWTVNNCGNEITEETALVKICEEWGFETSQIRIIGTPYYDATDYQFIRFNCAHMCWLWRNGDLLQVYC